MTDNYAKIVQNNLNKLYSNMPQGLAKNLPGDQDGNKFIFNAFGENCIIEPGGITLGGKEHSSVFGILISLYALNVSPDICITEPFKAFKEFSGSMPYVGAFATHTENLLVPHVDTMKINIQIITKILNGKEAPDGISGDFSFIVYPLPKIALCYIFYEADDDFPASVKCLYSNNAQQFLAVDALADVGEYCSKKILELIL
ncbi:MAG: DUF3786 domain-containing protein [Desulfobacterales bacterium]|nr:DUF3786 domain-containing protein [Desulfobacterales bacterium]